MDSESIKTIYLTKETNDKYEIKYNQNDLDSIIEKIRFELLSMDDKYIENKYNSRSSSITEYDDIKNSYDAKKKTFHKNVYEIIRIVCSFIPTPFCTYIGQFSALLYEVFIYDIWYNKLYYIKNGYLKMKKREV